MGPSMFRGLCRGRMFDQEWRAAPKERPAGRPPTVASRTKKNEILPRAPSVSIAEEEEEEEGKGEKTEKEVA